MTIIFKGRAISLMNSTSSFNPEETLKWWEKQTSWANWKDCYVQALNDIRLYMYYIRNLNKED